MRNVHTVSPPLACLSVSEKQIDRKENKQDIVRQEIFLTNIDVRAQKTWLVVIPTKYLSILNLLIVYIIFCVGLVAKKSGYVQ